MTTDSLKKAWNELSPIQREVAEWDTGSLFVIAGPGSGKTRILTCRIAHILDLTRDKNFRILALTFTNKAADEMRRRIEDYVPGLDNRLFIGTFHSFCAEVLRQQGYHLGINPSFNIYSLDADLQAVLSKAIMEVKRINGVEIQPDKNLLSVIHNLKSNLILPEDCSEGFKDKDDGEEVALLYQAYEDELIKSNALDFDSLIFKTYELFNNYPAIAKRYRTVYQYLCIDEFQDTNYSQYRLVHAFTGDEYKNVFIVADDDQIIYQWNGASYKRIGEFINNYSPKKIQLPLNYRCPPEIVEMANNLISHNFFRTANKKPIEPSRLSSGQETVRLLSPFEDFSLEASGIAKDIRRRHLDNLGSVAVLGRNRKLLESMKEALDNEGLNAIILHRKDSFESTPFKWLHAILDLAKNQQNQISLESVCGTFAQLTQNEVYEVNKEEVIRQAGISNDGYLQQWIKIIQEKNVDEMTREIIDKTFRCLVQGRDFISYIKYAKDWFEKLVAINKKTSEISTDEVFAGYPEELDVWNNLVTEITRRPGDALTLEAFLQELQLRPKEPIPDKDEVVLMTIHGAKGREFDHVYIIGLVDDILPSYQSMKKGDNSPEMEEERRNCFVAITRTIKTLTMSYAEKYDGWHRKPSRFINEMGIV
ncbi:MAG: ATP-dependent helicase [Candidatus Thermoplasmatota archaeon]|nr:ATP-dependent helicase [Candidatus Thermoplasmatota archaeon]